VVQVDRSLQRQATATAEGVRLRRRATVLKKQNTFVRRSDGGADKNRISIRTDVESAASRVVDQHPRTGCGVSSAVTGAAHQHGAVRAGPEALPGVHVVNSWRKNRSFILHVNARRVE